MRVVVVGAGVLGASAAYHLARAGLEVTLVDRADEGRATAAGAGIVCPWGSTIEDAANYALLAGGARYYSQLVALLAEDGETDLGYARVGGLYVPAEPHDLDALERRARARAVDAPEAGRDRAPVPDGCASPVSALTSRPARPVGRGRRPCRWTPARRSAAARRGEA